MVAGLRGSSSGIPASTLPTRSAPTSAPFVKMPPPKRANFEVQVFSQTRDALRLAPHYDLYVLDGNHRLEWHRLEGVMVDAIVLSASFAEAIELLCHFPMVKTVGAYTRGAQ